MNRRRLLAPTALLLAAGLIAANTATAEAAAKPYHILNVTASNGSLNIYGDTGCNPNGSIHILQPGSKATSLGWDSMRSYGHRINVLIYDDKTGNFLDDRSYASGVCVNVSDNSHRVQVL